jgi:hypothetical protein
VLGAVAALWCSGSIDISSALPLAAWALLAAVPPAVGAAAAVAAAAALEKASSLLFAHGSPSLKGPRSWLRCWSGGGCFRGGCTEWLWCCSTSTYCCSWGHGPLLGEAEYTPYCRLLQPDSLYKADESGGDPVHEDTWGEGVRAEGQGKRATSSHAHLRAV